MLADEVNRATPKAQSALLEAMEEHQVTTDGQTYPMTEPFFVIATQNPVYQVGTFPLPESQLDRFLMRIELGYPAPALERQLLLGRDRRDLLASLPIALTPQQLLRLQGDVPRVHASDALLDYVQAIAALDATVERVRGGTLAASGHRAVARRAGLGADAQPPRCAAGGRAGRAAGRRRATGSRRATRSRFRDAGEIGRFVLDSVPVP